MIEHMIEIVIGLAVGISVIIASASTLNYLNNRNKRNNIMKLDKMVRPVICLVCRGQMYYHGEVGHVPEVSLSRRDGFSNGTYALYAHKDCWDNILVEECVSCRIEAKSIKS